MKISVEHQFSVKFVRKAENKPDYRMTVDSIGGFVSERSREIYLPEAVSFKGDWANEWLYLSPVQCFAISCEAKHSNRYAMQIVLIVLGRGKFASHHLLLCLASPLVSQRRWQEDTLVRWNAQVLGTILYTTQKPSSGTCFHRPGFRVSILLLVCISRKCHQNQRSN